LTPASNLLALVITHPGLLVDAGAEEFWLNAPMPASWQQQLHHLITELHIASPELSAAELHPVLQEEVPSESHAHIARAMEALGLAITQDEFVRAAHAERLWAEVINDIDCARLKTECAEAEAALAREMTEENLERLTNLKAQLESIERERSRFYREDPLTGTVG
jgi:hypothetical protein